MTIVILSQTYKNNTWENYESGHILQAHVSAMHPFLAAGHQNFASIVQKLWPFYSEYLHFFPRLWKNWKSPTALLSHALTNISDPSVVALSYSSSTLAHAVFTHAS